MTEHEIITQLLEGKLSFAEARAAFDLACVEAAIRAAKGCVTRGGQKIGIHRNTMHLIRRRHARIVHGGGRS